MSIIDDRTLQIVASLTRVGVDDIALELLSALRAGRINEESEDELERIRSVVLRATESRVSAERRFSGPPPEEPSRHVPVGDEQVAWAAELIEQRISGALSMLESTLGGLQEILSGSVHGQLERQPELLLEGREGRTTLIDVWSARSKMPELGRALRDWSTEK